MDRPVNTPDAWVTAFDKMRILAEDPGTPPLTRELYRSLLARDVDAATAAIKALRAADASARLH